MSSIVDFFTSKTNTFAAVAAAIGLVALLHTAVRPYITDRGTRRRDRGHLEVIGPDVGELAVWGNSRDLRFMITNSGGRPAVLRSLSLRVDSCEPSMNVRTTKTAAPVTVYEHRVELAPGKELFDIRKRHFGKQLEPLNFDNSETTAFLVKLVSRSFHNYRLRIEAEWYDSGDVERPQLLSSDFVDVDFPRNSPDPALERA